jgi:hypothetical protein
MNCNPVLSQMFGTIQRFIGFLDPLLGGLVRHVRRRFITGQTDTHGDAALAFALSAGQQAYLFLNTARCLGSTVTTGIL